MRNALVGTDRYDQRRRRAAHLAERWTFAAEVLALYGKLLDAQEAAFTDACESVPEPASVATYAAERVLPRVIDASLQNGPQALIQAILERFDALDFQDAIAHWLRGDDLDSVARYLARAASAPVLEALGERAREACEGPRDDRHCPTCGGLAQVSYFAASAEDLVTPHRYLECARCASVWAYSRMTCALCGETESERLGIYGEAGTLDGEARHRVIRSGAQGQEQTLSPDVCFPHLRIDACRSCSHYLLNVDLGRDAKAIPAVDEIAAIPLHLWARERGLRKAIPNLMEF